jgi:CBS domain-containing protein
MSLMVVDRAPVNDGAISIRLHYRLKPMQEDWQKAIGPEYPMSIRECCKLDVVCCDPELSLPDTAALMRKHHVGDVVVIESRAGIRVPIGIVTDRDIVMETMALQLDAALFTAGDIMNTPLVTVKEDAGFVDTLRLMRSNGIRRMPVVTESGTLYGIVTADDIVRALALELSLVTEAMSGQTGRERRLRK